MHMPIAGAWDCPNIIRRSAVPNELLMEIPPLTVIFRIIAYNPPKNGDKTC